MALVDDGIVVVAEAGMPVVAGGGVVEGGIAAVVAAEGVVASSPDGACLLQPARGSVHAMMADRVLSVMERPPVAK